MKTWDRSLKTGTHTNIRSPMRIFKLGPRQRTLTMAKIVGSCQAGQPSPQSTLWLAVKKSPGPTPWSSPSCQFSSLEFTASRDVFLKGQRMRPFNRLKSLMRDRLAVPPWISAMSQAMATLGVRWNSTSKVRVTMHRETCRFPLIVRMAVQICQLIITERTIIKKQLRSWISIFGQVMD